MYKKKLLTSSALTAHMALAPRGLQGAPRMDATDGRELERLLREVQQAQKELGDGIKQSAEDALKEAKNAGEVSAEVKAKVDEMLVNHRRVEEVANAATERLEALETRNQDLEQQLSQRPGDPSNPSLSMGQQIAQSDAYKDFEASGFQAKQRIPVDVRQAILSPQAPIYSDRENELISLGCQQILIRDLFAQGTTSSNKVDYFRQAVRTNAAAPVAEDALLPESQYEWVEADAPVRLIGHFAYMSHQAMSDAAQLQGEVDSELFYGQRLAVEAQLIAGDGTGQNLNGAVPQATGYAESFTVSASTHIDVLRQSILQVFLNDYAADGIVLNPIDWAFIETQKDAENRYLFATITQMAGPQLWGLPVVQSKSLAEDQFLTGAFRMAGTVYDREDAEVLLSTEDGDNFRRNRVTARCQERLAFAVKRSASMVTGDLGRVP